MDDNRVAATILAQLGGRRFTAMTGAKNFIAGNDHLLFQLPAGFARDGINKVKVTLDWTDTYTVEFLRCNFRTRSVVTVSTHSGVYDDGLQRLFAEVTGLDTHL